MFVFTGQREKKHDCKLYNKVFKKPVAVALQIISTLMVCKN